MNELCFETGARKTMSHVLSAVGQEQATCELRGHPGMGEVGRQA